MGTRSELLLGLYEPFVGMLKYTQNLLCVSDRGLQYTSLIDTPAHIHT